MPSALHEELVPLRDRAQIATHHICTFLVLPCRKSFEILQGADDLVWSTYYYHNLLIISLYLLLSTIMITLV